MPAAAFSKIIVDEKKLLSDPGMREKLPKEVAELLQKSTSSASLSGPLTGVKREPNQHHHHHHQVGDHRRSSPPGQSRLPVRKSSSKDPRLQQRAESSGPAADGKKDAKLEGQFDRALAAAANHPAGSRIESQATTMVPSNNVNSRRSAVDDNRSSGKGNRSTGDSGGRKRKNSEDRRRRNRENSDENVQDEPADGRRSQSPDKHARRSRQGVDHKSSSSGSKHGKNSSSSSGRSFRIPKKQKRRSTSPMGLLGKQLFGDDGMIPGKKQLQQLQSSMKGGPPMAKKSKMGADAAG